MGPQIKNYYRKETAKLRGIIYRVKWKRFGFGIHFLRKK
jgi:hypothetical protein